jgi:hypothetical protein
VGDVYRTENAPGIVFEEVTVRSVSETVPGPRGPVTGAMIASELHADGAREDKLFAPGYGEFRTAGGGDLEALALAVPTDAREGSMPADLRVLAAGSEGVLEAARLGNWENSAFSIRRMQAAWKKLRVGHQPPRIAHRLSATLAALTKSVRARERRQAEQDAIDVSQPILDLQLQYRPPAAIDASRFHLWTQQLRVDAAAGDLAGVTGDVAVLEWIRDRIAASLGSARGEIDARLVQLRGATDAKNLPAAADHAARLGARIRG